MNLPLDRVARSSRTWTMALGLTVTLLALPADRCQAQGFGYGFPGMGYGMGYPGMGYGMGYPGMGYGYGYGYGLGLGAGFGLGSGYPSFGYGYAGATGGLPFGGPYSAAYYNPLATYGFNYGMSAPMLGVGLTPLGTSSALTEHYMLGRNIPGYSSGYGPVRYTIPVNVRVAPGAGTAVAPGSAAGTRPNVGGGTGTAPGTGTGVTRP